MMTGIESLHGTTSKCLALMVLTLDEHQRQTLRQD
jgi:hypothetical protein